MAESILSILGKLCTPPESNDFFQNEYLPALKDKISRVKLPLSVSFVIVKKFTGTLIKILFSFLYQEKYLAIPGFNTKYGIEIGASLLPQINGLADGLTGNV